ncbi:MAG: NAD(P)-dependent glycerol-3-phosphate dehydrogenase [Erysipelothrix sp.]|nr:NAD(P)-dependent glycerol-3-phosphate dehydrogenase [Erysipelothrix sp.]
MLVGVIGNGSWGVALAQVLCDNNIETLVWGRNEHDVNLMNTEHTLKYFDDVVLSEKLVATTDFTMLKDADLLLIATPTKALAQIIEMINENVKKEVVIINVAKGLFPETGERLSVAIKRLMKPELLKALVALVGPTHAEEVIVRQETAVVAVSEHEEARNIVQSLFSNEYFRVYTSDDLIGAEIGAAVKNVIAIAGGIIGGVGLGDNAQAALITRGLTEISRLGQELGGRLETFLGLTGVGDLIVTATSIHSRNYKAGFEVGKYGSDYYWENNKTTVEGALAVVEVLRLANELNIEMPISQAVYDVLYEGKDVKVTISNLMKRDLKAEHLQ